MVNGIHSEQLKTVQEKVNKMTVKELYDANNTPYDEVLIKFKDEGLDENDPRKDTDELEDIYLDLEVKSFWFESAIERRKEKVTNFFVIVVK